MPVKNKSLTLIEGQVTLLTKTTTQAPSMTITDHLLKTARVYLDNVIV